MSTSMPSAGDRSPSTTPSTQSGRRFLSRITSPFASKSRTITDFFIEVDDPHKQYSPGDLVTGCVRLRVVKPVRVTHIVVGLHGFAQVFKNPGSPNDSARATQNYIGTGRGKKSGEYFGNGFASLFEDEVVLCGDGRLAEGSYQFNFELEFPDRDLPSSIDFERGTISYMITATMTRPTAIAPTLTCDRKIYFVERIDISPLQPPRPRTITLEPVSKRSRAKSQARKLVEPVDKISRKGTSIDHGANRRTNGTSSTPSTQAESEEPGSPSPSDTSFDTHLSHTASRPDTARQSQATDEQSGTTTSKASSSGLKSINATVESLHGGCLRGDTISIKVSVDHTKIVRSLYGVIVTLYRQARVDMHPAIPLGPSERGKESRYEDYYPKSMTGLGGLSLSGAGSSHVFRKDLAQTLAPLYVDPNTLTAEVNAKVRVPEDAFPTISTVPGAMISFKYHLEVVLDIQGKLGSADRTLGNLGGLATNNTQSMLMSSGNPDGDRTVPLPFGATVIDTTQIRRDKGVVTCTFEIVVGTRDSERRKGKKKVEVNAKNEPEEQENTAITLDHAQQSIHWYDEENGYDPSYDHSYDQSYDPSYYHHSQWYGYPPEGEAPNSHQGIINYDADTADYDHQYDHQYNQPPPIPIPSIPDESQMSEKERLRQAEMRLLPSQPPGMENGTASNEEAGPSAPFLPDFGAEQDVSVAGPSAPAYEASASADPSASLEPNAPYMPENGVETADVPLAASLVPDYSSPMTNEPSIAPTHDANGESNNDTNTDDDAYASSIPYYQAPHDEASSRAAATASDEKRGLEQQDVQPDTTGSEEAGPSTTTTPPPHHPDATAPPPPPEREDPQPTTVAGTYDSHADVTEQSDLPKYER